jgi:hypothetical protein
MRVLDKSAEELLNRLDKEATWDGSGSVVKDGHQGKDF